MEDLYKISKLDSKLNVERSIEELKSIVLENISQVVDIKVKTDV